MHGIYYKCLNYGTYNLIGTYRALPPINMSWRTQKYFRCQPCFQSGNVISPQCGCGIWDFPTVTDDTAMCIAVFAETSKKQLPLRYCQLLWGNSGNFDMLYTFR